MDEKSLYRLLLFAVSARSSIESASDFGVKSPPGDRSSSGDGLRRPSKVTTLLVVVNENILTRPGPKDKARSAIWYSAGSAVTLSGMTGTSTAHPRV